MMKKVFRVFDFLMQKENKMFSTVDQYLQCSIKNSKSVKNRYNSHIHCFNAQYPSDAPLEALKEKLSVQQ